MKHNDIFTNINNIARDPQTNATAIIVPHVCNNVGVFGGGFAKDVGQQYPIVKENFIALGKTSAKLGKVQYVEVFNDSNKKNKIIFANMIIVALCKLTNNPILLPEIIIVKTFAIAWLIKI